MFPVARELHKPVARKSQVCSGYFPLTARRGHRRRSTHTGLFLLHVCVRAGGGMRGEPALAEREDPGAASVAATQAVTQLGLAAVQDVLNRDHFELLRSHEKSIAEVTRSW